MNKHLTIDEKVTLERIDSKLVAFGFKIELKDVAEYSKHTFECKKSILNRFFSKQKSKKIKIKDAINEALELWSKS